MIVISGFGFESGIWVLIAPIPSYFLYDNFIYTCYSFYTAIFLLSNVLSCISQRDRCIIYILIDLLK